MTLLPDIQRIRTLNALKARKEELLQQLRSFPLIIELGSLKKRKLDIENQILEVEHGIDLFSRPKVFVPTDQYEESLI